MIAVPPESVSGSEVALSVHYERIRNYTELLAAPLSPEDQTVQSMPDVSPTKWHRAHVTWFFETFVLSAHEKNFKPYQERYWFLFNSYYEQVGPRFSRPLRGVISRPGAHDVGVYRECVDRRVQELLRSPDLDHIGDISSFVKLGLHHEQQHQELLLMDIKHVLSLNPLRPAYGGVWTNELTSGALGWLDYTGGLIEIGNAQGFAFDSELPRHRQFLEPYRLADRLTTNGEWMAFIDDGGYGRSELWLSDGWARVNSEGWQAPLYWTRQDGADIDQHLDLIPNDGTRLVGFLGGTIGNYRPAERHTFLSELAKNSNSGDTVLIGVDLIKDPQRLIRAYDDAAGVTAEFNINVLRVLNRGLGANFSLPRFQHVAAWNDEEHWIEMRLQAKERHVVDLGVLDIDVEFAKDEVIRTEVSTKFTRELIESEFVLAGLTPADWWSDGDYALALARKDA